MRQFPSTFAMDSAIIIIKIVPPILGIFITLGGAYWGYGFFKVAGTFPEVWLGYLAGGFVGLLISLLIILPVWVAMEVVEIFINIEINRFIGNRRDSPEHLAVKRKAKLISPYIWRSVTVNPKGIISIFWKISEV